MINHSEIEQTLQSTLSLIKKDPSSYNFELALSLLPGLPEIPRGHPAEALLSELNSLISNRFGTRAGAFRPDDGGEETEGLLEADIIDRILVISQESSKKVKNTAEKLKSDGNFLMKGVEKTKEIESCTRKAGVEVSAMESEVRRKRRTVLGMIAGLVVLDVVIIFARWG